MRLASGIIITHQADATLEQLEQQRTTELFTVIRSLNDKGEPKVFTLEEAKKVVAKAYVASEVFNYIILVAPSFNVESQNKLLKIIEEPPHNKGFIILTPSKSALLDTIQSRLPVTVLHDASEELKLSLDLENLNLARVYEFAQEHSRISAVECKVLVEKISLAAMKSGKFKLDEATLKLFSDSIKALDMGSPTTFILNLLLLKLLARKR